MLREVAANLSAAKRFLPGVLALPGVLLAAFFLLAPQAWAQSMNSHTFTVSAGDATQTEPSGQSANFVRYTLTRTGPAIVDGSDIVINWVIVPTGTNPIELGDMNQDYVDQFDFASQTFSGSDTSQNINLGFRPDDLNEGAETFLIRFSIGDQAAAMANGGVTVPDDFMVTLNDGTDDAISVSIAATSMDTDAATGVQVPEGRAALFTVTLSRASEAQASVPYTIGGDVVAADYSGPASPLTIPAGRTTGIIRLLLAVDADTTAETLTVSLGTTASDYSAAGTIARSSTTTEQSASVSVVSRASAFQRSLTVTAAATHSETDAETDATFTISFQSGDTGFGSATEINWAITHGTTSAADFTNTSGVALIPASSTADVTFTVGIVGDNVNEPDESFTLNISAPAGDTMTAVGDAASMTIADDDSIVVTLSGGGTLQEGVEPALLLDFGAELSRQLTVRVNYEFDDNPATNNIEISEMPTGTQWLPAGTPPFLGRAQLGNPLFQFAAGATGGRIPFPFLDDTLNEATEVFQTRVLEVSGAHGEATVVGAPQVFTVEDNDPITLRVTADKSTVNEGQSVQFTVDLVGASSGTDSSINILYTATGLTFTPGDSNSPAGILSIPYEGSTFPVTRGTITLSIPRSNSLGDSSPDQTLSLTLTEVQQIAPTSTHIGDPAIGVINLPDSPTDVTVSFTDAAHSFGFSNPTRVINETDGDVTTTYTVNRDGPAIGSGGSITITWTYAAGATNPPAAADFMGDALPAGGTLMFTSSDTSETFDIVTKGDNLNEANENFTLTLSIASGDQAAATTAGGASVPTAGLSVTIADDDPILLNNSITMITDVAEGTDAVVTITVVASGGTPTADIVLPYHILTDPNLRLQPIGGDETRIPAVTADDYTDANNGSITIASADSSGTITISLTDDDLNESTERLYMDLSPEPDLGLARPSSTGEVRFNNLTFNRINVTDNDAAELSIAADSASTREGGTAAFTVTTDHESAGDVTVAWTAAVAEQGTANPAANPDISVTSGTATITAGELTAAIEIPVLFDNLDEGTTDETLTVTLGAVTRVQVAGTAAAGAVTVAASPGNAATTNLANLNAARTVSASVAQAMVDEGDEIEFIVTVDGRPASTAFDVSWTITGDTADYTGAASGMVSFTASSSTDARETRMQSVRVTATDDMDAEDAETLSFAIADPCPTDGTLCEVGGRPTAFPSMAPTLEADTTAVTATIRQNDQPVTLQIEAPASDLTEGTAANFTVSFAETITTTAAVTATWTLSFPAPSSTVNPAAAADFATLTGTASIDAGSNSVSVPITAMDDAVMEADEDFTITLSAPAGGGAIAAPVLAPATPPNPGDPVRVATAKVAASDPLTISITAPNAAVSEGAAADFTVNLVLTSDTTMAATSGAPLCVMFSTRVQSQQMPFNDASSGADISVNNCAGMVQAVTPSTGGATGGAVIAAGVSSGTISIVTLSDGLDEGATAESLDVTLTSAADTDDDFSYPAVTVAASPGDAGSVDITNLNAPRSISVSGPGTQGEDSDITFTITVTGEPVTAQFNLDWTLGADSDNATGDATLSGAGADISSATSGSVTVPVSTERDQTLTVTVTVVDDSAAEDDEVLTLTLTDPCAGMTLSACAVGGRPSGFETAPGVSVDTTPATATIGQSDQTVTLQVEAPGAIQEALATAQTAATGTFTVRFTESVTTSEDITAGWRISYPSAVAGPDATRVVPASAADLTAASAAGGTVTILAGASSGTFTVTTAPDLLQEPVESFTVELVAGSESGGGAIVGSGLALHATMNEDTATIAASDDGSSSGMTVDMQPTAMSAQSADEGSQVSFGVRLFNRTSGEISGAETMSFSTVDVCVAYELSITVQRNPAMEANTATNHDIEGVTDCAGAAVAPVAAADGVAVATGGVNIPAGMNRATFTITLRLDGIDEGDTAEELVVQLTGASVPENSGLTAPNVNVGSSADSRRTANIGDISAERALGIAATTASADEGGNLVFTVSVIGRPVSTAFSVAWMVTAGASELDSTAPTSGMADFVVSDMGTQTQTITLATAEDADSEGADTVTVTLTDPCGAGVCDVGGRTGISNAQTPSLELVEASADGTIRESDRPVTLQIEAPASDLTEGTAANFSVSFAESVTTTEPVTATYTITFPAASSTVNPAAAADFATLTGTATIPLGATSADLPITAMSDALNEAAESFTITLSAPAGGGAIAAPGLAPQSPANPGDAASQAGAQIAASDPLTVSIAAPDAAAVPEGSSAAFTLNLVLTADTATPGASAAPVCVMFGTEVGNQQTPANDASSGADIVVNDCAGMAQTVNPADGAATGGAVIPAGQSSATLSVRVRLDEVDEGSTAERLTVTLNSAADTSADFSYPAVSLAASPDNAASVDITNVSAAHAFSFTAPAASIVEGASATYTVTRVGPAISGAAGIVLSWSYTAGATNPASAADFAGGAAPGSMLTFTGSETTQTFTITTAEDAESEAAETFTLGLSATPEVLASEGGLALPDDITVTIGESDRPVTLQLEAPAGVTEGTAASFTVRFTESVTTSEPVTVDWAISFPAAAPAATPPVFPAVAADFAAASGTATIPMGMSNISFEITATADMVNEAAESFTVTLSNAAGGGAIAAPVVSTTAPSADLAIAASDSVTARIARSGSGAVIEGGNADFTVSLVLDSDATMAATSGGDICVAFSTLVANQSSMAANDADSGADISVPNDCDGMAVTVTPATGAASGGILIPAGQSSVTLSITTLFDSIDEGSADETLQVTLSSATPRAGAGTAAPATGAEGMANASIQNVNSLRTIIVTPPTMAVDEDSVTGQGETVPAVFTITLDGSVQPASAIEVGWSLNIGEDGTITAPGSSGLGRSVEVADVSSSRTGSVTFAAGPLPQTQMVTVDVQQDALNEGAEMLRLTLDPVADNAGGQPNDMVPGTRVVTGSADATVAASDDITVFLTAVAGDPGTVTVGQDASYTLSFGTTRVNGQVVPIVPTTQITVPLTVTVAGTAVTVPDVVVQPGSASAAVVIPASAIGAENRGGMLEVATQTPTGAPSGATARVASPADVTEEENRGQTVSVTPPARQVAGWTVAVSQPSSDAPEGAVWSAVFTLSGATASLAADGIQIPWSLEARSIGGAMAAEAADFIASAASPPDYTCGANAQGICTTFPEGTVTFTTNSASEVIVEVRIRENDGPEGDDPQGFRLTLGTITGGNAARTMPTGSTSLDAAIPALRANLSVADAVGAEGANAEFVLTLSGFSGGSATTQPIIVAYALADGPEAGGARSGVDFTPPTGVTCPAGSPAGSICTQIPMGAEEGTTHRISVQLIQDGVLEPRETFTLTITGASGGGGTIRLVADPSATPVVVASELTATGIITDDADQAARRRQRVSALVTVLDRQTAQLATDAITERLSRPRAPGAQTAQLSIANRNLLARRGAAGAAGAANAAGAAGGGGAPNLGLALYGAAGLGGTEAGLSAGAAGRTAGRSGAGRGAANAGAAFGGLGAGLAGAANMGTRTALPSLAQVLNGSSFRFGAVSDVLAGFANFADGIEVWGSGGYVDLRSGNSQGGLEYDGESIAAFIGADAPVPALPNLTTGLALGWSAGDLDFTDTAGGFSMNGELSNDSLSLHPYLGWQISPHTNAWLVLGIGFGGLDIEEQEGSGAPRKLDGGDTGMLMVSTGIAGTQQIGETGDLKLRFALTHVHSRVDSGRFDDGALLPKTRGRSLRLGGEAEAGRRIALENGLSLRPFGTLRVRVDNASSDAGVQNAALDWGAGISAAWSDLGLDGRFAFRRQLNDTGDEEQGVSLDLNFAPGASGQGIAIALQTALQQRRAGLSSLNASGNAPFASSGGALGSVLGASAFANAFGSGARTGTGAGMQHSLSGEIAYGVPLRYAGTGPGRAALLTPYGRFDFANANTRWATGLRLSESGGGLQLGLEAGLDLNSGSAAAPRSYDLLFTGRLHF